MMPSWPLFHTHVITPEEGGPAGPRPGVRRRLNGSLQVGFRMLGAGSMPVTVTVLPRQCHWHRQLRVTLSSHSPTNLAQRDVLRLFKVLVA
jgi:hypothetical protein